jgi:hypothetical protein
MIFSVLNSDFLVLLTAGEEFMFVTVGYLLLFELEDEERYNSIMFGNTLCTSRNVN